MRPEPTEATPPDGEPNVLPGIGFVLVAGGFAASFLPGWTLPAGLGIWAGCGLGLTGPSPKRWSSGLAIAVVLAKFGTIFGGLMNPQAAVARGPAPVLAAAVHSAVYHDDELTVTGTIENTGEGVAYDPAIDVNVFDETGETLLAGETAYPTRSDYTELPPGERAPFTHLAFIPDAPRCIRWSVTTGQDPGAVVPDVETPRRLCQTRDP